ncbi:MAG TPA: shikimate kinase [Planctomycetota bacterium]
MTGSEQPRAIAPLRWPCDAELSLPGSKSEANRMLVAAATSGRTITVTGATPCEDVRLLVAGLEALGFEARFTDEARGDVRVGPRTADAPASAEILCGNAGTALRFLVSVAAITPGQWTITGDAAMQRRPIGPLVAAWQKLGADIADTDGCPPVRVRGGGRFGNRVQLDPTVSSQFVSSLLLAGACLPAGLDVEFTAAPASIDYAQWTCNVLRQLGIEAALRAGGASVRRAAGRGPGEPGPGELRVSGDWSAMGVWTCIGFLSGSVVRATNLCSGSGQPDEQLPSVLAPLRGHGERTVDVSSLPDQFPNLAIVAALRTGTTRLVGAANLRHKECDRIAVMARELTRADVAVQELRDGLVVHGNGRASPTVVDPEQDHRIAMAFALLGLVVPGVAIRDPGCVAKSYPGFWRDVEAVQRSLRCVAVVGMRGAGKSTFARALANETELEWLDTDRLFEARHGPIAAFVAQHGWPAFRAEEAQLVAAALAPGRVVSTGGGAVEHAATRALLRTRALTVWLDGQPDLLRARLLADATVRPSVTGAPPAAEVDDLLARRLPQYAEVAAVHLDAASATAVQVQQALRQFAAAARVFEATR